MPLFFPVVRPNPWAALNMPYEPLDVIEQGVSWESAEPGRSRIDTVTTVAIGVGTSSLLMLVTLATAGPVGAGWTAGVLLTAVAAWGVAVAVERMRGRRGTGVADTGSSQFGFRAAGEQR
jgi:hypothetical protein